MEGKEVLEGIQMCMVRRKRSLKIIQEVSAGHGGRISDQGIDERISLARSKSASL